jgi:hypothetical protein
VKVLFLVESQDLVSRVERGNVDVFPYMELSIVPGSSVARIFIFYGTWGF